MANPILEKVIAGNDLTEQEMMAYLGEIMSGEKSEAEIAAFLTALKIKGESVTEIVAGAKVLREKAAPIDMGTMATIDTCGTGGDSTGTYNISTAVAIVAAAAGVPVVKHGNRSVSSKCGCADVLEASGVKIDLTPDQVKDCVNALNIGFLFAPTFHSAMRFVGPTRKALGFRTIFNILGPLANPANATAQVVGVFSEALVPIYAEVLKEIGLKRVLVVHGKDGLDEITITDETMAAEVKDGKISYFTIQPEDFGIKRASLEDIKGGETQLNAQILRAVLAGEEKGPKRDILLINAGAALYVAGKADSLREGMAKAAQVIDNGKAVDKLEGFITKTNTY